MRISLAFIGLLMLIGGLGGGCSASARSTTVESDGREIHNSGLIAQKQADVTFYVGIALVGAVFFGAAAICEQCRPDTRLTELAEDAGEERGAMLRALQVLAARAQQHVAPTGPVAIPQAQPRTAPTKAPSAKPAAADPFDAAVNAELPGRKLR